MRLTTRTRFEGFGPFIALGSLPPVRASFAVVAALLLIFSADRATGVSPVQHLYYLPIVFAGVRFRTRGGVATAVAATLLYHAANPQLLTLRYGEGDVVQIVLFLAVGVVTAKVTHDAFRLHHLANTDDLTGLHNLRSFEARLAAMVRVSREARAPLALLVLDLDRLKALNDHYGHLAGAEAVRAVGHIIKERIPLDAVACRYGGDEFVIAVARCTPLQVQRVAEDLRHAVHRASPVLSGHRFAAGTLSVSVGVSCASFDGGAERRASLHDVREGESLFRAADAALYRAKASGRNQVCVSSDDDLVPRAPLAGPAASAP